VVAGRVGGPATLTLAKRATTRAEVP